MRGCSPPFYMRPVRPALTQLPVRLLIAAALVTLVLLTLIDRGATRIYATPWNALFWLLQLAPLFTLALRAAQASDPLHLPPRRWAFAAGAFGGVVILSAVLSPYRGVSVLSSCELLAAIAGFFLLYNWLAREPENRAQQLLRLAACFSLLIVVASLGEWVWLDLSPAFDRGSSLLALARIQNAHPLGHTSYTAGLALLALPWPVVLARRTTGRTRLFWSVVGVLAAGMLFSSGSRGGVIGFVAFMCAALWLARWSWQRKVLTALGIILVGGAGAYAHPRTRTLLFERAASDAAPNLSNVQRSAMAKAGWLMGRERPLLGWGVGTTARAYPKFRSELDGGVETALQLHSMPVQLWADLGVSGIICVGAFVAFLFGAAVRRRRKFGKGGALTAFDAAILTVAGYGAFSLTDYQLDVPVCAFGLSVCVACLAAFTTQGSDVGEVPSPRYRYIVAGCALTPLVLLATLGKTDPVPELNIRALELAADPAQSNRAIALLQQSLRLNPDQEVAHFNLGWLLIVRDPVQAEQHFLSAAHLVPDKGGVYFGLALSRINRTAAGDAENATRALALECLNDPIFLVSPWWSNPAVQPLRAGTLKRLQQMGRSIVAEARSRHMRYVDRETEYVSALADWVEGTRQTVDMITVANTEERKTFFQRGEPRPDFTRAKVRKYRRERVGYPVLMRDLDLPAPIDVFEVQENDLAAGEYRFLFPAKGWVPSPELLKFLQAE